MAGRKFPWAWLLILLAAAIVLAINICYIRAILGSNLPTWAKFLLLQS